MGVGLQTQQQQATATAAAATTVATTTTTAAAAAATTTIASRRCGAIVSGNIPKFAGQSPELRFTASSDHSPAAVAASLGSSFQEFDHQRPAQLHASRDACLGRQGGQRGDLSSTTW